LWGGAEDILNSIKFIEIGAAAVVGKDGQVEGLGSLVQVEEKRRRATPV